ncbi:hypothetical protein VCHENC02_1021, partial [Vibrio harveyi]
MNLFGFFY